ncbi:MAG TPA: tRNA (adenosine(37)-N6)-threonylcarbamoyltransferase complex dimerization subunit type 1 TsaB [Candidatus Limnocylindrales bacterium]|nr:tRNA (adenosine(37)-N6)-threonylcarbamoyltransferase complex dimerization subunit type 1 TsaB [Candidatus Limnocylindrales bacterium]
MLLALDTATQMLSIALHDGTEVVYEQLWRTYNHHTVELAPAVQCALARTEGRPLTAMAVATGPGTYSGLRVGVAFAKGLAVTFGVPLVGMTTLDILAAGQPPFQGSLIAVVAAGRGRIVASAYGQRSKRWKQRRPPESVTWDALLASIDGPALFTGEIDAEGRAKIEAAQAAGESVTLAPAPQRTRRAAWLAEEAWTRMREDADRLIVEAYDPVNVAPVYVRTRDLP